MAAQQARVGDIVIEMVCKCGKVLIKLGAEADWRCRDCHRKGSTGYRWRLDPEGMTCLPSRVVV